MFFEIINPSLRLSGGGRFVELDQRIDNALPKSMVSNSANVTAEGYALDARQNNANIYGSLRERINSNASEIQKRSAVAYQNYFTRFNYFQDRMVVSNDKSTDMPDQGPIENVGGMSILQISASAKLPNTRPSIYFDLNQRTSGILYMESDTLLYYLASNGARYKINMTKIN